MILSRAIAATFVGCFWIFLGVGFGLEATGFVLGVLSATFIFVASYRPKRR